MAIIPDFSSVDTTTVMVGVFLVYAFLHSPVILELVRRFAPPDPPAPPAPPAPVEIRNFGSWTCPCHARVPPGSSSSSTTTTNTATTNRQGVSDQKDKLA
ncbi:hypothetical protein CNMCM6106_001993 [Aspergillus hiratsukae]|uniref:Uncharacterized protein n=1 Tax=Aspergillus hiratsukae TaxID=1194566 RepID=A0A8H6Q509_9EURO|nr:hypothetical protein CNMCM6106_001993 [Aspergillus hiratsukae]